MKYDFNIRKCNIYNIRPAVSDIRQCTVHISLFKIKNKSGIFYSNCFIECKTN